jgi:hypothetical protein
MKATVRRAATFILAATVACLIVLPTAVAGAAGLSWDIAGSQYGSAAGVAPNTAFVAVPAPAPPGVGATSFPPGPKTAYGLGTWDAASGIYAFGFLGTIPIGFGQPTMSQTELAGKDIQNGSRLRLRFTKAADAPVKYLAMVADPDQQVTIDLDGAATLQAADHFFLNVTIADPVKSATGDVQAAFGFIADMSTGAALSYQGAVFLTNMHWLDIKPPTVTSTGVAGLAANGFSGVTATFDGIFSPALISAMGIQDPAQVQGYVDTAQILPGATNASFAYKGVGTGSDWQSGWYKYRITNGAWSVHNILYGRQAAKPGKPTASSPKGVITAAKPTFKWKRVAGAKAYEVRVYKGSKLLVKKTGITVLSWRSSKALAKGAWLTWKVRASNANGAGAWSTALKFKVK